MRHTSFLYQCHPGIILFASLLLAIFIGTIILSLPIMHVEPIACIDVLFTTTSVLCATGFFSISLDQFTMIGKLILMILIQIGGLGLITLTLFFVYSFSHLDLSTNLMASKLLDMSSWRDIRPLLFFICCITLISELIGSLFFLPFFLKYYDLGQAVFLSFFHAISAFCNAGVWLLPPNIIAVIGENIPILMIMALLIFIGGIGFITLYEIWTSFFQKSSRTHISLHTKLTLIASVFTVLFISIFFMILEYHYSMADKSFSISSFLYSLFHGVSLRSAGFTFKATEQFHPATLFLTMMSGFIGSGSFSTGSGVKVTTIVLLFFTIKTIITGRSEVEIQGRAIPYEQVNKSIAIVLLSIFWICISTFFLLIASPNYSLGKILFAIIMAYSNLGIFSEMIGNLTFYGKLIIITTMIIGKVGPLTLIIGLMVKKRRVIDFSYPEERIMLG